MTNVFLSHDRGLGRVRQDTGDIGAAVMCGPVESLRLMLRLLGTRLNSPSIFRFERNGALK